MIEHKGRKVNRGGRRDMETERKVLTVQELAEELRISRNLAYRQVREGKIYSVKCGDRYLIPVSSLMEWLRGTHRPEGR